MTRRSYHEHDSTFGQAMLTLRTSIGLTQAGLADLLGVSRRAVGEWEGGLNYPKAERLQHVLELWVLSFYRLWCCFAFFLCLLALIRCGVDFDIQGNTREGQYPLLGNPSNCVVELLEGRDRRRGKLIAVQQGATAVAGRAASHVCRKPA